jgi:phosphatidate cytidylyltransferase
MMFWEFLNPLENPLFLPTLVRFASLFAGGFGLVLFFARKDLRAGLRGELGLRFVSWLGIASLYILAVFAGGMAAIGVLLFFCFRAISEYVQIVGVKNPYAVYLYTLAPITLFVARFLPQFYFTLPAGSILLLTLVPLLTGRVEDLYLQLSYAGRGYLYLLWSIGHVILLYQLAGPGSVVLVGVSIALSDVMQYTVGKLIGRHIISPQINPRKAWEGLIGDVLGAGLGVLLFGFVLPDKFTWLYLAVLAVIIGIGAAWGDLISSLLKRASDVKDWGAIVPGHGGLLDRANSMVVAFPLAYYFTYFVMNYG